MEGIRKPLFPKERRRHKRFELSLALAYQWGMLKGTLRTVDVSLGGVRIQTETPMPIDERLDLIILFEDQAIKPLGKVLRSSPWSNQRYDIGICFETISHQCVERLERFLHGIPEKREAGNWKKAPGESTLTGLKSKPLESDRLRGNFLRWLHQSYPGDYQRYTHRPVIGENEIWDFLKRKGIDKVNIYYLMKSLKGG
jgi:hypothetical protein